MDDAAATLIYGKSPVDLDAPLPPEPAPAVRRMPSADESAQHLEMPQERASERASIEDVLAAPTGPPPPSSRSGLPVGPPSGLARAAAAIPEPPAPPPRATGSLRTSTAAKSAAVSGPAAPIATPPQRAARASVSGPAAPIATPPPPAPRGAVTAGPSRRHVVTTKLPREEDGKRGAPLPLLLAAVAAATGATAFLLMSRTSTLVVNLADGAGAAVNHADVFVDGAKRCSEAPCVVRDIAPGSHEVKVVAAGYAAPAPRTIAVDGRRDVLADFQLTPAKGTGFKVTGSPGVRLAVDGKDAGVLPIDKEDLDPGEHELRFAGDRYVSLDKTIRVAAGEVVDLGAVPLKVAKGRAVLELLTPGAKVNLIGPSARKEVTQLPIAIEFDPSEKWEIVATKDGYEEFREPITFEDGQAEKTISIALGAKAAGNASASASSSPSGSTPAPSPRPSGPRTALPPSRTDGPKSDDKPSADPEAETFLKINSLPAASIMLDGKSIGVTPQPHVVVTPGSHTVTFVNSELSLKKTITVDVKAGESKAAFARLRDGDE
jgi:serine/threonine-protein kinase